MGGSWSNGGVKVNSFREYWIADVSIGLQTSRLHKQRSCLLLRNFVPFRHETCRILWAASHTTRRVESNSYHVNSEWGRSALNLYSYPRLSAGNQYPNCRRLHRIADVSSAQAAQLLTFTELRSVSTRDVSNPMGGIAHNETG